jgi:hypothetical protein
MTWHFRKPSRKSARPARRARPSVEALEERALMAFSPAAHAALTAPPAAPVRALTSVVDLNNHTLAQALPVPAGDPALTGQVLLANPRAPGTSLANWYAFTPTYHAGTSVFEIAATITSGQGSLTVSLYTPTSYYWKSSGTTATHPNTAYLLLGTAIRGVTYYLAVRGIPGLTYSLSIYSVPT